MGASFEGGSFSGGRRCGGSTVGGVGADGSPPLIKAGIARVAVWALKLPKIGLARLLGFFFG